MATEQFISRHIGPRDHEIPYMLKAIGVESMDKLIYETFPDSIRLEEPLVLPQPKSEFEYLKKIKKIAQKNKLHHNYIGLGYYETITPSVIQRNMLENPSWYTPYTPYQAEIAQGRLEALLNFQTAICNLTGMELANASLLDEATAVAEAMGMLHNLRPRAAVKAGANEFFVDEKVFPQTLAVLQTRAEPLGIEITVGKYDEFEFTDNVFGAVVQYPNSNGEIVNYEDFIAKAHENKTLVAVAADILSLAILTPPGEWDADIVVGSTQRFGIPMGYGGPHAAYFATREKYKRNVPGRIIGVSKDANGKPALRMALQTREQHIKRERATSNICTAQALLASMAGMYAVYHGAEGLKRIAKHIHHATGLVSDMLEKFGYKQQNENFFDTLNIALPPRVRINDLEQLALKKKINLRYIDNRTVGISIGETITIEQINRLLKVFAKANNHTYKKVKDIPELNHFDPKFSRKSDFLTLDIFNRYRSETDMMRYIKRLERKDFSLTHSMISLGSCTMKLNAATEMLPLTWMEFTNIHPFAPVNQAKGYHKLFKQLRKQLARITGLPAVSLQPNSGAAGEFTGLMVIRAYHKNRGEGHRNIVLIPASAHGTNPASAVMAGSKVVVVKCDEQGNVDIDDLKAKAEKHADNLSAFMVTFPSTHGVFESDIMEFCRIVHQFGGQVYMDGANLNAQVGLTDPAKIGADVCHLNLHKTFAIPHGGGGPGAGPIAVAEHLAPFLPGHPLIKTGGEKAINPVAAAPYGSANIFVISHAYISMLGDKGLTKVSEVAILNANYLVAKLKKYYDILYLGAVGKVAHEMILECRKFRSDVGISEADIAKRLMDYGFHAPTLSFPVHGTLMVEPTESESLNELDRFVEAMISIYHEIIEIKEGKADKDDNVLKNAPHTLETVTTEEWEHKYSREKAVFPLPWVRENKFFPSVGRVDDAYGDRNLMCTCAPLEEYREE